VCGIVGFIRKNVRRTIDPQSIEAAFVECEKRGRDATGYYYFAGGKGVLRKKDEDATDFTKGNKSELKVIADSAKFMIGHCRAATYGRGNMAFASNNENNHPFEGKRWVLVHNGMIKESPEIKDYKYAGDCDSEIILSYLETWGIDGLHKLSKDDSFSLVIYDKKENKVYFIRNKNPMLFAYDSSDQIVYFGSTDEIVYEFGGLAYEEGTGIPSFSVSRVLTTVEGFLYSLDISNFQWHQEKEKFEFLGCASVWKKEPLLNFKEKEVSYVGYTSCHVGKSMIGEALLSIRIGTAALHNFFDDESYSLSTWRKMVKAFT
jgi:predicted glutamine amidotransferase